MSTPRTALSISDGHPATLTCDALVLASVSVKGQAQLVDGIDLPRGVAASINETLVAVGAQGSADEVIRIANVTKVKAPLVLVVGTGSDAPRPGVSVPDACAALRGRLLAR